MRTARWTMLVCTLFLLADPALAGGSPAEKGPSVDTAVWPRLQQELTGTWRSGRIEVNYRPLSPTTLIEAWRATTNESLTVYAPDGPDVMLTHYCPQGNQPRLKASRVRADTLTFHFVDVGNKEPGQSMLVALTFRFEPGALVRTETYRNDAGADEVTTLRFVRAVSPSGAQKKAPQKRR